MLEQQRVNILSTLFESICELSRLVLDSLCVTRPSNMSRDRPTRRLDSSLIGVLENMPRNCLLLSV